MILCHMGVLGDPLLHLDGYPETVDTKGDEGQEEPLDVVTEQLSARAVKDELSSIDNGVLGDPVLLDANSPGKAEAKGEHSDQALQNADADHAEKSAGEFRFHKRVLLCFAKNVICHLLCI